MVVVVDALVAGFTIATGIIAIEKYFGDKRKKRKERKAEVENLTELLPQRGLGSRGLRGGGGASEASQSLVSLGASATVVRNNETARTFANENAFYLSASALGSRTAFNAHRICRNALLYRQNSNDFAALTRVARTSRERSCKHCNTKLSQARLRLSRQNADFIWITAAGMLKAHCALTNGSIPGWTCIWMVTSSKCRGRFANERELLEHMKEHHVRLGTAGRDTHIDWPADMRHKSTEMCGFGASIGGREMLITPTGFIVPGV